MLCCSMRAGYLYLVVEFVRLVLLYACSEIVAEGLIEGTISVRKVDAAEIDVADVKAAKASAKMARKRALLSIASDLLLLDGIGDYECAVGRYSDLEM